MDSNNKACEISTQNSSPKSRNIWLHIIFLSFILVNLLLSERHRHSPWTIALAILIVIFLIFTVSPRLSLHFLRLVFGTIGHVQIFSPDLEQRIRTRYQSEIHQLNDLGFDYQFSDGETFPLIRLVLLLPALVIIMMWRKREVMTIHEGTKYLVGHPVYISKNKTAFAEPSGLGTKFYTAFHDGSLLISTTYTDGGMPAGPMIERHGQKASISETWASHQQRIAELETEGKRVDHQTSYQAYAEIEHKETASW